jgi:hypothetical protein
MKKFIGSAAAVLRRRHISSKNNRSMGSKIHFLVLEERDKEDFIFLS